MTPGLRLLLMTTALSSGAPPPPPPPPPAVPFRYYRIYIANSSSSVAGQVAEIELRDAVNGGVNRMTGATIAGVPSGDFTNLANLNDNNASTACTIARTTDIKYISVDLGAAHAIQEVVVRGATTVNVIPSGFHLVGSNDEVNWTPLFGLAFINHNNQFANREYKFRPVNFTSVRNWGIICMGAGTAGWHGVFEMELRETVGGPNIATGGTARATNSDATLSPGNAFDGSVATNRWGRTADTTGTSQMACLFYDFGSSPKHLQEIALKVGTSVVDRCTVNFMVFATNRDLSNFPTSGPSSAAFRPAGVPVDIKHFTTGNAGFSNNETRVYPLQVGTGAFDNSPSGGLQGFSFNRIALVSIPVRTLRAYSFNRITVLRLP